MSLLSAVITPVAAVAVWYKLCRPGYNYIILSISGQHAAYFIHVVQIIFHIYFLYLYLISYSYQGCMSQWCTATYLTDCCVGEVHIQSHMYRARLIKRQRDNIRDLGLLFVMCAWRIWKILMLKQLIMPDPSITWSIFYYTLLAAVIT